MKPIYKCICDVCRSNEANQHFKVKKLSGVWTWKGRYEASEWAEHIICDNVEVEDGNYKQFVDTIMTTYIVDPETIGQYTGLTDKNGRKIFEGDIVIFDYIDYEDERGVVQWDSDIAKFIITFSTFTIDFDNVYGRELEVVGNVYDNPEMMEKIEEDYE